MAKYISRGNLCVLFNVEKKHRERKRVSSDGLVQRTNSEDRSEQKEYITENMTYC